MWKWWSVKIKKGAKGQRSVYLPDSCPSLFALSTSIEDSASSLLFVSAISCMKSVCHSALITTDKCGLNCSPAVGVSLIIQPNCLDPSPGGDPGSTYVLSGVSWTEVGIWHLSHLELPQVTHQTVSSTTLSPFEFSARPCCSLQMRVLVWSRTVDCCILWLLNVLGSWAAWIGCLMGANQIAEGGKAGTGTWRRYGALRCLYSSSNHIYVKYCTQSS